MTDFVVKFVPKRSNPIITFRAPELSDAIDVAALDAGVSRSEFLRQAVKFALDNMKLPS